MIERGHPVLLDSHAHLSMPRFQDDLEAVIERACAVGVEEIVIIGSGGGARAWEGALEVARRFKNIYATAGIHPHEASSCDEEAMAALGRAVSSHEIVAVGETGLDYYYDRSPRDVQRRVFQSQLELARQVGKPVVIHTRDADDDTLALLRDIGVGPAGGVVHCFSGDRDFAARVLDLGLSISFSGILTFPKADELRAVAAQVPDEALLIETDCPYLSPAPHRGRRNEPSFVVETARTLATIRGLSLEDVARITAGNARRLFGLEAPAEAPIVYPIRDQLYVNATNRCTLSCQFCPKRRDWRVKGHLLHLRSEPSEEQLRAALGAAKPEDYREVVFCGLGEPTMRLEVVQRLGEELRLAGLRTRLDTDGLASLREGRDVTVQLARAFSAVSVSLNAADGETYQRLCPSPYGPLAWSAVVDFLERARGRFEEVVASVVAVPGLELEPIRHLAEDELGVRLRVRPYNVVG